MDESEGRRRETRKGRRGDLTVTKWSKSPAAEANSGELKTQQPGGAFEREQRGNGEESEANFIEGIGE